MVIAPDLVSDVKTFFRNKGIDFKVLMPDLQVRDVILTEYLTQIFN